MNKYHLLPLLLAPVIVMGANTTQKSYSKKSKKKNETICPTYNSLLTVGGNYSRINFKPSGESSFNGNLGGAHAMYEYRPQNAFYGAIQFNWRQGSMDGSSGKRTLLDLSTAEKMGYTLVVDQWLSSFYAGFGFRYLGHHLQPSSSSPSTFSGSFFPPFLTGATSIKFDYYEFYFPVGFKSEYKFSSWFTGGLTFEWMPQAFSTVQIRPLGGAFWTLKNKLANFLVEMPLIFSLTRCGDWKLSVNPFYERWQDGRTTAKTSKGTPLGLPGNSYNFYGANLNLIYSF